NTLLHEVMKDDMRGRIFSSLDVIMHVGFLVFMLLTSMIAEWVDKGLILAGTGIIFSFIGLAKNKSIFVSFFASLSILTDILYSSYRYCSRYSPRGVHPCTTWFHMSSRFGNLCSSVQNLPCSCYITSLFKYALM
ncbi:hypothetical protein ACFL2G_05530, partial [Candidatus Omnitrophota bacterium]